jgi:hypothetical protein
MAYSATEDLRALAAEEVPEGYLTVYQTMRLLRVSSQTVWQRVKRREIKAVHVRRFRLKVFDQTSIHEV